MKLVMTLLAALALVSVTGIGAADHQESFRSQFVSGKILLGHPATLLNVGVNEALGPDMPQGIDGQWIALEQVATGDGRERVLLYFSSGNPLKDVDLNIWFYDEDFSLIDTPRCATNYHSGEDCRAPAGAAYAVISGNKAVDVSFQFEYSYPYRLQH